ncbi:fructose-bisphosphate aldolase class II [Amycolatopsis bartoniae]|uniref:Fructose-bisphosphate aldolase n=1 Tax=Amycolatopsis bartoniae TaxID=941986 RepID=A0A8H9MFA4_9PSEU|nr:ketose-bisphosphate aldolase [Amycolatopsis bartoniae]MBB2938587.1 fructose-bisphosphate aldolase class II [Amycolatopsis bartoniae]TVT08909.1 ketose-bisphosphate aldolase [Amycolatopsis bartoniae]GHF69934.1 fructose-bisphosphate aldolase [Amycolatopsis bartoniae]
MPLAATGELVGQARERRTGIAAFNVITLEHAEGVVRGAESVAAPVILQISQNAVKFHNGHLAPLAAACAAIARTAGVPVALHLDHVEDTGLLHEAAHTDLSSAMFDASALDYDSNVAATRAAARWAHDHGLWLEAELGAVGGKEGAHAPGVRTDPAEAAAFVAATEVDALAVAVGSTHAMTTPTARLDHDLIARLAGAVPVPLVLHGSSGVARDELGLAVTRGMVKINIGTALNVALTGEVREWLAANPAAVDPRKYLAPARDRIAEVTSALLTAITTPSR